MKDVLEAVTGKRFKSIQNGSGHGPDGVFIDYSTQPATIYLAEAKSSVSGAEKAEPHVGNPEARLDKWMSDFESGKYDNADVETKALIDELQSVYNPTNPPTVKGVWVQVEVPKPNTSNVNSLGVILSAW